MSNGWSNVATCKVWTIISNDEGLYSLIWGGLPTLYNDHMRCSIFSRRQYAAVELGDLVKSVLQRDISREAWYLNMTPWAKDLFRHILSEVNWTEISLVLLENYENSCNAESRL